MRAPEEREWKTLPPSQLHQGREPGHLGLRQSTPSRGHLETVRQFGASPTAHVEDPLPTPTLRWVGIQIWLPLWPRFAERPEPGERWCLKFGTIRNGLWGQNTPGLKFPFCHLVTLGKWCNFTELACIVTPHRVLMGMSQDNKSGWQRAWHISTLSRWAPCTPHPMLPSVPTASATGFLQSHLQFLKRHLLSSSCTSSTLPLLPWDTFLSVLFPRNSVSLPPPKSCSSLFLIWASVSLCFLLFFSSLLRGYDWLRRSPKGT